MKVLHVITSLLYGGAEKLVVDLLPRFSAAGIDVELAVFNAVDTPLTQSLSAHGVKIHRFAPDGCNVYSAANLVKLYRVIRNGKYDIVHSHNTAAQLFTAMSPKPSGTVLFTTEHNTSNRRRGIPVLRYADKSMYSRYDRIICISDSARTALCRFVGGNIEDKCTVITNGIDLSMFTQPLGCIPPQADVLITMVAGFREQKDQNTLIRALAALPERFRLRLVGDGALRSDMEYLARDILALGSRVEFMGTRDDIPRLLAESHIQVMSSHYEGLSLSSVEALASGRPVVASDVAGLREVVGGAGILFKEKDYMELSRIIQKLADSPDFYKDVAEKCSARARRYDIADTARQYMDLYAKV